MKKKLFIVMSVFALLVFTGCGKKDSNNKEELIKNLETMGKSFYEEFYYPHQAASNEDVAKFLETYSENGIKADLENISKVSVVDKELAEKMVNNKTKEKCDTKKTTITFYPKTPYGKTDYEMQVNLECGFEK